MPKLELHYDATGKLVARQLPTSTSALKKAQKEEPKPVKGKKPEAKPEPKPAAKSGKKIAGLTLTQLFNSTPPYVKARSRSCFVKKLTPTKTRGGMPAVRAVVLDDIHVHPTPHKCSVIGLDKTLPKVLYRNQPVLVDCDCGFFTYTCEYALAHWGAAKIQRSNGEPASVTNPQNHPLLCIAEGQRVYTDSGLVPIENIEVGDKVLTTYGLRKVTAAALTGVREVVKLETRFGKEVICTPDHKILGVVAGVFGWHEARSYEADGTYVATNMNCGFSSASDQRAESEAYVLGAHLAEGSKTQFCQTRDLTTEVFKRHADVAGFSNYVNSSGVRLDREGLERLEALGYVDGSFNKVFPEWIYAAPRGVVLAFLRGLYDGDGYITDSVSTYASVSFDLARGISRLLTSLGVRNNIHESVSGVADCTIYLVRTSAARYSNKLVRLIEPTRVDKIRQREIDAHTSVIPFDVFKYARQVERAAAEKHLSDMESSEIRVSDFLQHHGLLRDSIKAEVFAAGVSYEKHDRAGGKPSHYADHAALYEFLIDRIVDRRLWRSGLRAQKINSKNSQTSSQLLLSRALEDFDDSEVSVSTSKRLRTLASDGFEFDPVLFVTKQAGHSRVYDLSVSGVPNFVVDGIVVHNCKHLTELVRQVKKGGF